MSKTVKQFIGFCMLLSIATSLFPVNFFHHHEEHEHSHRDASNVALETDPCHISMYHAQSVAHTCEHNSHATETEEECEFCKYITAKRTIYTSPSFDKVFSLTFSTEYSLTQAPAWVWNSSLSIKGRAPPTA